MKNTRILLCFVYNDSMNVTMEEVGLGYIGSVLRQHGYEVLFIAQNEKNLDYSEIQKFKPDIIAFPVYTLSRESVNIVSRRVKKFLPDVLEVIGGIYATYDGIKMLEDNLCIDIVIKGEGEQTMLELAEHLESKKYFCHDISGLIYRDGAQIMENPDRELIENMNTLPFPARDMLIKNKLQVALLSTSRGCYSNCAFCSTQLFWKKWRCRTPENVVDEMEYIVKTCNINNFNIVDGSFEDPDRSLQRGRQIAEEILNRGLFVFYFINIRAEVHKMVTTETLQILKESGLISVCIGIESGNNEDLKLYNKIAKVEDNEKVMALMQSYGISVSPGFINFNPYSTLEKLNQNVCFLEKIGFPLKFITFLDVYNHTRIYQKINKDGLIRGSLDGKYKYRYHDNNIEELAKYFQDLKDRLNADENSYYNRLDYYTENYHHILLYYRRILEKKQYQKGVDIVQKHKQQYAAIIKEFNIFFVNYLKKILEISSINVDIEVFERYNQEIDFFKTFGRFVDQINRERDKLNLNLSRAGYWNLLINS